jgi:hypothetical protein
MSFALTTQQIRERSKRVTRRLNWLDLRPGELIQACEKCMGRKKGEPLVRLEVIRIVSVRRENLGRITSRPKYGAKEVKLEGFPDMTPAEFVAFFCKAHRKGKKPITARDTVTRIAFEYVDAPRHVTAQQLELSCQT